MKDMKCMNLAIFTWVIKRFGYFKWSVLKVEAGVYAGSVHLLAWMSKCQSWLTIVFEFIPLYIISFSLSTFSTCVLCGGWGEIPSLIDWMWRAVEGLHWGASRGSTPSDDLTLASLHKVWRNVTAIKPSFGNGWCCPPIHCRMVIIVGCVPWQTTIHTACSYTTLYSSTVGVNHSWSKNTAEKPGN